MNNNPDSLDAENKEENKEIDKNEKLVFGITKNKNGGYEVHCSLFEFIHALGSLIEKAKAVDLSKFIKTHHQESEDKKAD